MRLFLLFITLTLTTLGAAAQPAEDANVPAQFVCVGGKLILLSLPVTRVGIITITIPPDVCEEGKPPEPAKRPAKPEPKPLPGRQA